jgi:diguanylate cyclase (GGDEF)-like protein
MGSGISMKKPVVLVVDDDITTVKFIAQAIKDEYEVIFALSAIECLQKASQALKPDLILLDVKMPKVDGFEICDTLKRTPETQHIPVVFITSAKLASDQVKGFELGATDYLTKPIDIKILKARLRAHIRQSTDIKHLEALVLTDTLTGVANRRKFNEAIESDWKLAIRDKTPISLLMIDIDDFKRFNDHYGHPEGDKCLISVSNTLQKTVERPIDMVARIGGEEFIILLPNTDLEGAEYIAQKVIDAIRDLKYPHTESSVSQFVTLSIGVSCAWPSNQDEPELIIQAADKGLYKAKHEGKNRYGVEHVLDKETY